MLTKSMKNRALSLLVTQLLSIGSLFAQIDVPVDLHTGNPSISIPVHDMSNGDIPLPISYVYTPGAIKLDDEKRMEPKKADWQVVAGGSISRIVQGLPDDFQGLSPDTRRGWLYGTGPSVAKNFIVSDATSSAQNSYYMNFVSYSGITDTEPDIFNFSFGGFSGRFVFDNDKIIQVVPYQDILITPSYSTNGQITSFTVKANDGKIYGFTNTSTVKERAVADVTDPNTIKYMREKYLKYKTEVLYYSQWSLTNVTSPSGATVSLSYEPTPEQTTVDQKWIFINNGHTKLYSIEKKVTSKVLAKIISNDQEAVITSSEVRITNRSHSIKKVDIGVTGVVVSNGALTNPGYVFYYKTDLPKTITYTNGQWVKTSSYYQRDFWGYYRGGTGDTTLVPNLFYYASYSPDKVRLFAKAGTAPTLNLNGKSTKTPNATYAEYGVLYKIKFPTGGTVELEYESNQYVDPQTNETISGAGIRVRKVTVFDGISTANNIEKEYTYSGGKLLNRPQYSLPIHTYSTPDMGIAKTKYDLNPYVFDGPNVIYSYGEEKQAGKGKTAYTFSVPAVYGQLTSTEYSSNNWSATATNVLGYTDGSGATVSKGMMGTGPNYYAYPYAPNPNYEFERGLIQNIKVFNETGHILKETDYEYTPLYKNTSVNKVYGVAFDFFSHNIGDVYKHLFPFSKYEIWTGISKVTAKETVVTADPTAIATKSTSSTEYFYGTSAHRMLTETKSSATFGGTGNKFIYRTRFNYPQDYTIPSSATDPVSIAIKKLQEKSMNKTVIQTRSTMQKSTLVGNIEVPQEEKTIGATVTKFAYFGDKVLPSQLYSLRTGSSLPNYTLCNVNGSGTFVMDTRLQLTSNFTEYGPLGNIVSVDDGKNHYTSVHTNSTGSVTTVSINNASADEVVYSGFEVDYSNGTYAFGTATPSIPAFVQSKGRIGYALVPNASYAFTKSGIRKRPLSENYIFSCWTRSSQAGTLTITATDGAGHSSSVTANIPATTLWNFLRIKVPVGAINSGFTINAITSISAEFDEMIFYPERAQVSINTYGRYGNDKIGESDTKGNVLLYQYDDLGRNTYVKDKDDNILQRTLYNYTDSKKVGASFHFYRPWRYYKGYVGNDDNQVSVGDELVFVGDYENQFGYQVDHQRSWNFGNGISTNDQGKPTTYTFTTPGTFTISCIVYHPVYGYETEQKTVTVSVPPVKVNFKLCVGGKIAYDLCSNSAYELGLCVDQPLGTNTFEAAIGTAPCAGASYTYKWEKALQSSPNSWILQATNTTTATTNKITVQASGSSITTANSYILRCTVTSNCAGVQPGVIDQPITFVKNCN